MADSRHRLVKRPEIKTGRDLEEFMKEAEAFASLHRHAGCRASRWWDPMSEEMLAPPARPGCWLMLISTPGVRYGRAGLGRWPAKPTHWHTSKLPQPKA